jgi:hypothetical protein
LTRPSTFFLAVAKKGVDARLKAGHDGVSVVPASISLLLIV